MKASRVFFIILSLSILFSNCRKDDEYDIIYKQYTNYKLQGYRFIPENEIDNAMYLQHDYLNHNSKRLCEFAGIVMAEPRRYPVFGENVEEVILSRIIISKELIPHYLDRFYIAHYIRNQINTFSFLDPDSEIDYTNPLSCGPYYFPDYDKYIKKNAEQICNVLYHFISPKYYGFAWHGMCRHLLRDKRLGGHLDLLIDKLEEEGVSIRNFDGCEVCG